MCGITGIFDARGQRPINKDILTNMTNELIHRGVDDEGFFISDGIGLGHRRLSVIDIETGQQPMQSLDKKIIITYNGMIYNYKDLRKRLESVGHLFRTNSDTEVLLYAYKAWGFDCAKYLDGFFAFTIYDVEQELLFAARDPFGKKPFYYHIDPDFFFYFASELPALIPSFKQKANFSGRALNDYFTLGFLPDHRSIYENVHKLPAGHTLIFKKSYDEPKIQSFSSMLPEKINNDISYEDAKQKTESLLRESIEKRLISDVPVGVLLSGGMDSAVITALASRISDKPIHTFTAGFHNQKHDERVHAKQISEYFGTHHTEIIADDIGEDMIDDIALIAGEPFADIAIIPNYLICKKAKENATVLLTGDGADEMFFGYGRYESFSTQENIKHYLSSQTWKSLFKTLGNYYPQGEYITKKLRLGATFEALGGTKSEGYLRNFAISRVNTREDIYTSSFLEKYPAAQTAKLLDQYFAQSSHLPDILKQAQYVDFKMWLAGRMLVKSDRSSMSANIELRSPFLDKDLAKFLLTLPMDFFLQKKKSKRLLRDIGTPYLPHDYLNRPKKGFTFPLDELLRTKWYNRMNAVIHDSAFESLGIFETKALRKILKEHTRKTHDHSRLLWAILQLDAFLNVTNGY